MRRRSFAARFVVPVALVELALLVATGNRYGYHRDELYFRVAARHPAWGYDDQPALTPLLGRFSEWAFGSDPRGLRVVSAAAMALVVVLAALIARELGAGPTGQLVASASVAAAAVTMAVGHLLSTTTFDVLAWMAVVWLVLRLLAGGDERQWLLVGLVVGIALESKDLILLLLVALAVGCLLAGRIGLVRSAWLWSGALLAALLWAPNLLWQEHHGWPQLELARKIADDNLWANRIQLIPLLVLLANPLLAPLWIAGLWWLLSAPEALPFRPLGIALPVLLGVALLLAAKPYYAAGLVLAVLGAGGVATERWLGDRMGRKLLLGGVVAASALTSAVIALPLLPVEDVHASPIPAVNEDAIETIGWPRFAETVASVWARLPRSERRRAVVFTGNYGEAGAIWRFGPSLGLPRAYSAHNAFWRFGSPPDGAAPVIVLGYRRPGPTFVGCSRSARIDDGFGVDNEEQHGIVWTCRRPSAPWSQLWPELRHLNP